VPSLRALIVEDDADIAELIDHYLQREGWTTETVGDGRVALQRARAHAYDVVLLDVELPGEDGLSVLRELRRGRATRDLPILMITARGLESDRLGGLELGAEPFSPKELLARIRAVRRRLDAPADEAVLTRGPLSLDIARHVATWQGQTVHLAPREFALLGALLRAGGRVLTREHLLDHVWGQDYDGGTRTVDVHVRRVREKLPGLAAWLRTVTGAGYRIAEPDE
jgi:two-component system, OmpR family, alkaline phosphatase synthesis response regulator PhoP